MIKALRCECCGGTINPATMVCEYCDTHYMTDGTIVCQVEHVNRPTVQLQSDMVMSFSSVHQLQEVGMDARELAKRKMIDELASTLDQYVTIYEDFNPRAMAYKYHAVLRVAD